MKAAFEEGRSYRFMALHTEMLCNLSFGREKERERDRETARDGERERERDGERESIRRMCLAFWKRCLAF